jgi:hypothetical protein
MSGEKQQQSLDEMKKLQEKELPVNVKRSIADKQKAIETNKIVRK